MTIEEIFAGESDNLEFKEDIPAKSEKYMKTVVAFANGSGGRIVFGVENNTWNVIGFTKEEVFRKMDAITNAIYDSCDPKISPSVGIDQHGVVDPTQNPTQATTQDTQDDTKTTQTALSEEDKAVLDLIRKIRQ